MAKVFIVEDEALVALELQERIKDLGHQPAGSADNGAAAIKKILETKPDVILMDINIKGNIDGIETARQIQQKINVPIIYLTAYSDNATLERAKITAPYGYIVKPIDERDLQISIEISLRVFEMENKLRDSENNLAITLKSIGEGIIAANENGIITRLNTAAERMCGLPMDKAMGHPLSEVFKILNANDRKPLENSFGEVFRTGKIIERANHTILISKDGTERHIAHNAAPILDDSGEIHGIVIVFSDVTESYLNRERLKQSEKLYREVIENAHDVIFTTDKYGTFIFANASALKLTGYVKEDLVIRNFTELVAPEYLSKVQRHYYRQALEKNLTTYLEVPIIKKDSGITWFGQNVTLIMHDGEVSGFQVVARDITDKKLAEEALRKNELLFQTLANVSPVGIFKTDANGYTTYTNPRWSEITGIFPEDALGYGWLSVVHNDDKDKLMAEWNDAAKTNRASKADYRCIKQDGSITWVIGEAIPEIDKDGRVVGYVGTTTDITERKKYELEIKLLANALKSINECVTITNLEEKVIFVNQSFINTYGYSEKEIIGQTTDRVDSPKNPSFISKGISEAILTGGWQGDMINTKKDGTEFPIRLSVTVITDENDKPIATIGVATDISIRKQNEAELIKLNQAVIQSPASIVMTDINGIIEYANPKASKTSGYSLEELIGQNPRILRSREFSGDNGKELWDTITSGKEWVGEFYNKQKTGEVYCESASISPIKNSSGVITHYMAVKEDITDKKKMELGLIEAKEKAEKASELKDAFIANISHEIRTPLNGILGMTSILQEVFADHITSEEEPYFEAIDRSSKRIIRTIDMILNFSRLQVGDFKSNPQIVRLDELINELHLELYFLAKQKELALSFENKIGNVLVRSDSFCLNQIITNLVDNAIKYTTKGSIDIILYEDENNTLKIDIADTGIGISDNYLEQLFQPYTQENVGFSRPYEGVGLGLSLVKKFLFLIDADISVKSKKNIGTTFTISFKDSVKIPLDSGDSKIDDVQNSPVSRSKEGKRPAVLIIEDEQVNQMFLTVKLHRSYEVTVAENATKAMGELELKRFDIILMDISLKGGLSGVELTRILKETDEYKNIPVIAVTGHAFDKDREKCMAAGCDDYIAKPFKIEELEKIINKFI